VGVNLVGSWAGARPGVGVSRGQPLASVGEDSTGTAAPSEEGASRQERISRFAHFCHKARSLRFASLRFASLRFVRFTRSPCNNRRAQGCVVDPVRDGLDVVRQQRAAAVDELGELRRANSCEIVRIFNEARAQE